MPSPQAVPEAISSVNTVTTQATTPAATSASASTQTTSQPQANVPKGRINIAGLGLALSLDVMNKPAIQAYNSLPTQDIRQELPLEVRLHQQLLLDILGLKPISQSELFNQLTMDQMEFEQ
jgi:hypothetical protein